ncbi:MAG: response regulator [Phycisphaerae bacterium]
MSETAQPHVLVVDDEPDIRELLTDALGASGLRVTAAGSGQAALDISARQRPDFLVTDLRLGDCTGLDVIDRLRDSGADVPAVVITGRGDPASMAEASRRRPVELMTKPLDLDRLTAAIRAEIAHGRTRRRRAARARRLRGLARQSNIQKKTLARQVSGACADLTAAFRDLSGQFAIQKQAMAFQNELVRAANDDDVFKAVFRLFVKQSGTVFGVAMVCDASARLRIAGRFGVPVPDSLEFCEALSKPVVDMLLAAPKCLLMDATEDAHLFAEAIRRRLVGVSILAIPLVPADRELIGVVILYRKGEQPFTDADVSLGEMIGYPTALAVRRND